MEAGFVKLKINFNISGLGMKEENREHILVGKGAPFEGLMAAIRNPL